jgi:hypothetical protein
MDAAADAARYQLNDAPESPFTVEFATEVLVEIHQSALEAFRSLPYGGLEVGGVLFGRVSPSGRNPKRVGVEATRPIECDHAAGPAFILSSGERLRLAQLFEHARHEEDLAALAVVGFWVSHGRSELGITPHDADLYRAFFPHPWQVALALKPQNKHPLREALFCRVNGRVVAYRRPTEPVEAPTAGAVTAPTSQEPVPDTPEPIAEPLSLSDAPEPQYLVPDYREPESLEPVSCESDHSAPEPDSPERAPQMQQAFPAEPFRIPSFQERVWQEQQELASQERALPEQEGTEEQASHAEVFESVLAAPPVVKPPTAAELPRFATDIYLPTPPVEPPSPRTWPKDLYRPAGRARVLLQPPPVLTPLSEAPSEEVGDQPEPAEENVAALKPQDDEPSAPSSFELSGPSADLLQNIRSAQSKDSGVPEPGDAPVDTQASPLPPAEVDVPIIENSNAEAPATSPVQVAQAAEIGDELARLLVSIRAAAADTKTKRPVVENDDPAVGEPRQAKHSFGILTVVLLMIAGLVLGGVLGYWFFGNHQSVAAKAPGPDLGLEMFNTGKEVLIHWDAKSPLVLNARVAELRIHDSGMVQTLLLDLSGLSRGYYRYQPTSSDIQTTLVVTENDGRTEQSNASHFAE